MKIYPINDRDEYYIIFLFGIPQEIDCDNQGHLNTIETEFSNNFSYGDGKKGLISYWDTHCDIFHRPCETGCFVKMSKSNILSLRSILKIYVVHEKNSHKTLVFRWIVFFQKL